MALESAIDFLHRRGYAHKVPADVMASIKSRAVKQGVYQLVRNTLWAKVYDAVYDVLSRPIARTGPETRMRIAVSEAYQETAYIAYEDGGGSLPIDDETQAQISADTAAQLAYVSNLFQRMIDLRREGDVDQITEAFQAADRWTLALDGFYNSIKMAGAGNIMLTWYIGATEQHCKTCANLDEQRHRASWYRRRGYYPKKPGAEMDCGGYRCDCELVDDKGTVFSL